MYIPTTTLTTGSATSTWDLTVDLPLTTGTGWGMTTGWTNDGAKMIGGTDASQIRNQYQTVLPLSYYVAEVEIQIPTGGRSAGDQRAGLIMNWNGSGTGFPLVFLGFASMTPAVNGVVDQESDAINAGASVAFPFALDTWHTLRLMKAGPSVVAYVNSTLVATFNIVSTGTTDIASYLGLYGYQIDAWFRNLKVWTLTLP